MFPVKSYVQELSRVSESLFLDFALAYPDLKVEFERDLAHLHALVGARGLRLYTSDLPAVAKHFDRCLSTGQYVSSGLPLTQRVSRKVVIPKFLRGLYLLVFDEFGSLRENCDVCAIAFIRQLLLVGKKATVPCSDDRVLDEIEAFVVVDQDLSMPPSGWDGNDPNAVLGCFPLREDVLYNTRLQGHEKRLLMLDFATNFDKVVGLVCSALRDYCPSEWNFRHGPGAVAERTGCINKYTFMNWSERLERVYPYADTAFHSWHAWGETAMKASVTSGESPSRLIAVPKTVDRPRLIAAEPTEHQWCQQNIWHYIGVRSSRSWISKFLTFHSQELNQQLCLKSSADGSLCTLDLSSASDRVTCRVVQQMFWRLPNLLRALHATRTRFVELPLHGGLCLSLRKFATMGSACTFPVESLIFLSVALACTLTTRRMRVTTESLGSLIGEVAVFGDDIIVPVDTRELVVEALELLEFKINTHKSFWEGNFRESCGCDAFRGIPVTPAYWRGPNTGEPESVASTVAVHNNFLERGLLHSARYLASTVQKREAAYVSAGSGVFGLKSHVMPEPKTLYESRWNEALQRDEVRLPQLVVEVRKSPIEDDSALLQYFTESPEPSTQWKGGVAQRPRLRIKPRWVAVERIKAQ